MFKLSFLRLDLLFEEVHVLESEDAGVRAGGEERREAECARRAILKRVSGVGGSNCLPLSQPLHP